MWLGLAKLPRAITCPVMHHFGDMPSLPVHQVRPRAREMYYDDHPPPHFHVRYGEHRAILEIETAAVLE